MMTCTARRIQEEISTVAKDYAPQIQNDTPFQFVLAIGE